MESFSPQRQMAADLQKLWPNDGKPKLIFVPADGRNRLLFSELGAFQAIYRTEEKTIWVNEVEEFLRQKEKLKVPSEQTYFFMHARNSAHVYDFSTDLRALFLDRVTTELPKLVEKCDILAN